MLEQMGKVRREMKTRGKNKTEIVELKKKKYCNTNKTCPLMSSSQMGETGRNS